MDAGIQEGELAQAMFERRVIIFRHGEGFGAGEEGQLRPALALGIADHDERRNRHTMTEFDEMLLAVAPDTQGQPGGERIHHRDAHAVKAAGDLVAVLVEFAARMQLGHDHLGRRDPLTLVDVGGDTAPVIVDRDRAIGVEDDVDLAGMAGQRLVDGVVHHLVDHVMQAGAVIGVADIHARTLAHGVESLEHLDRFGAIGVVFGGYCWFSHQSFPGKHPRSCAAGRKLRLIRMSYHVITDQDFFTVLSADEPCSSRRFNRFLALREIETPARPPGVALRRDCRTPSTGLSGALIADREQTAQASRSQSRPYSRLAEKHHEGSDGFDEAGAGHAGADGGHAGGDGRDRG